IKFMIQLFQLASLIRKYGITREEGLKIVFTDRSFTSFSFFNIIFINKERIDNAQIDKVLAHEIIHVKQKHSVDLIILEILTIVQWFNPLIWLYRSSLKGVHEYLADEGVVLQGYNRSNYQDLLLSQAMGIRVNEFTHSFNQSLIKKRIIMMTKLRSKTSAKYKVLAIVPVLAIILMAFSGSKSITFSNSDVSDESYSTEMKTGNSYEDGINQDIQNPQKQKKKKLSKKELEKKKMMEADKKKIQMKKEMEYKKMSEADKKKMEKEKIMFEKMSDSDKKQYMKEMQKKKMQKEMEFKKMSEADKKKLMQKEMELKKKQKIKEVAIKTKKK
ncbi:M56 family metallopeptidase, partial [Bacteroidota bacterium]